MLLNLLFYIFSFFLLISGLLVISLRNPVHAVLFLIFAFFNASALFLLSGAEFLAMILLVVYVGAVIVLFLFVVMMINIDIETIKTKFNKFSFLNIFILLFFASELITAIYLYRFETHKLPITGMPTKDIIAKTNTEMLGNVLYTQYSFYFELTGIVLLLAMISAITLALHHKKNVKRQSILEQVSRTKENAIEIKKVDFGKGI